MKKIIALVLVLALCLTAVSVMAEGAKVKVGFIFLHDENSTYDLNFINGAKEACEKLGVEYVLKTGVGESEDHNAFASIYEGRFLGGVAAGLKLNQLIADGKITAEEAKLGYIGAYTYAEVISGYTSFFLGARSVCPSATMEVTFTGSWYDPTLEQEAAIKLINDKCVVISEHADSMGAPGECQTNGIPFVFYNGSAADKCPDTYIVASRINWAPYFEFIIDAVQNGKEIPADWTGTLDTESVVLCELNENAAAPDTAKILDETKAKLQSGELKVFDTAAFTVDGKTLDTYMADVDTDEAYTGDTEVIKDGYFHESEFRSAPYFDLKIDGITLLDTKF